MEDNRNILQYDVIVNNMTEGILVISFDGIIKLANKAAQRTLGFKKKEIIGEKFARLFFDYPRNDRFSQTVLDAVYDRDKAHHSVVPYYAGDKVLHLRVLSSFLIEDGENLGVIIVFSDLSELMDLRDSVRSMEKIKALNDQLEMRNKLLSETFGRFLSDDIVRLLLDTPDGLRLGGNKQKLTIMMSDLRGFTAMSERMDAEDLISMLNHYLGEMTEIIQARNGTIIEFIGDGIFALFGAPEPSDSHAADAVAAALEMQQRMEEINRWNDDRDYPVLEMGIGINTGEVIVGNIGSEKRTKYGVVGSQVNLCGRIESYTVGGQILISSATKELIGAELEVAKTMHVYPKGANGELELSQITGIGAPYNIHVSHTESIMQQLESPIPVRIHRLDGKHEIAKAIYGGITAVARDGAELETDAEFEVYDNIQINAGGKLFCKVTEKTDDVYCLQYTSIPTGYAEWLKNSRN